MNAVKRALEAALTVEGKVNVAEGAEKWREEI